MTIQIRKPELETLIRERMAEGGFQDVEEALLEALKAAPPAQPRVTKKPLGQFLLESPLRDSGLKLDRKKDHPEPVEL